MKIYFIHSTETPYVKDIISIFKVQGLVTHNAADADIIFCFQLDFLDLVLYLKEKFPKKKFITFIFDAYSWITTHPRGYEWDKYGQVCAISDHCITVDLGQKQRIQEHWGIDKDKISVTHCYSRNIEYNKDIFDANFVFCPLRRYEADPFVDWFKISCQELQIPYKLSTKDHGNIGYDWESYLDILAQCSFLVSHYYEHGSGGMSCPEALQLGKVTLFCDSPFNAGKEYLGDLGYYFQPNITALKERLLELWKARPTIDIDRGREFFNSKFTKEIFFKSLYIKCKETVNEKN